MWKAQAVTNEKGHFNTLSLTIGTGGHGDTAETYNKRYTKEESWVSKSKMVNSGKRDSKGKIIYDTEYFKVLRFTELLQVRGVNLMAFTELLFVTGKEREPVKCYDLFTKHLKGEKIGKSYKAGLAITIKNYEVRIIKNKCYLMKNGNRVQTFKQGG